MGSVVSRLRILELIPHQHGMCLLDEVAEWDSTTLHARSRSHQRLDNPLRFGNQLSALHLCEYGAQAMAVHGGLKAAASGGRAQPGLLVSLRAVELQVERIDLLPGVLDVFAEALIDSGSSWQYQFRVEHAGDRLAEGRAAVMLHTGAGQ